MGLAICKRKLQSNLKHSADAKLTHHFPSNVTENMYSTRLEVHGDRDLGKLHHRGES